MIPAPLAALGRQVFASVILPPLRHSAAVLPLWPTFGRVSRPIARLGAQISLRLGWLRLDDRRPLDALMAFVHGAEELVGIEGSWELLDQHSAVRRVHCCPHAESLKQSTQFCTRVGTDLGLGLADVLVGPGRAEFKVVRSLSQGDPHCEYELRLLDDPQ